MKEGLGFSPHTWTNGLGLLINLQAFAAFPARKLLEYRDAHDVEEALRKSGLSAAGRRALLERAGAFDVSDASVDAETLKDRTGLSNDAVRRVLAYRDAHDVTSAEGLREAGLDAEEVADALDRLAPAPPAAPNFDSADAFVWHADGERLEPCLRGDPTAA